MVATDMYGKSPYGSGYTEIRERITFSPFLFSFLIFTFDHFCYIFTLHHCSVICWDFVLRLICWDMCITSLFVSVIILFVYGSDRYGTAATSGEELFMIIIYGVQLLPLLIGGFVWHALAVPDSPLVLYFLSVRASVVEKPVNWLALAGVCMIRVVAERYYWADFF